jgi:hypothetical protein
MISTSLKSLGQYIDIPHPPMSPLSGYALFSDGPDLKAYLHFQVKILLIWNPHQRSLVYSHPINQRG